MIPHRGAAGDPLSRTTDRLLRTARPADGAGESVPRPDVGRSGPAGRRIARGIPPGAPRSGRCRSSSRTITRTTATPSRSPASASPSRPARSSACSGPTAPARRPPSARLAGILTPTRGRLLLDGHDVQRDAVAAKSALAYVPDDPQLFDRLTVWEHFRFIAGAYRLHRLGRPAPRRCWPGSSWPRSATPWRRTCRAACGRRWPSAAATCTSPRAVLLDEPLTGLDPRGIRTMKDLIREHAAAGAAIIVSSHLLSLFEDLITTVLVLHRGRVVRHGRLDDLRGETRRRRPARDAGGAVFPPHRGARIGPARRAGCCKRRGFGRRMRPLHFAARNTARKKT